MIAEFISGCLRQYLFPGKLIAPSDIPVELFVITLIFIWYYIDSNEKKYKRNLWLNMGIIALWIIVIPYYMFRTRNIKTALKSIFILFLLVGCCWLLDSGGEYAVYTLFQS